MKSITVKAGATVRWEVKIGGEPIPEVKWFKGNQQLENGIQLTIDTRKNEHTILCIPSAMRSDVGEYRLTVKNSHGADEEKANLTVLDRPSKPNGPLEVSDVFEDNLNLSWKPPDDDGGEPIEYYEVEKLDTATGRWVPCAKVKDTKAHIDGLKKGQTYQFRVKAVNKEGASDALSTDKDTKAKNPYDEPGKTGTPDVVDWDADRVSLEWEPPKSDGGAPITQYVIEKKGKHGRDWQECGKVSGDQTNAEILGLKEGEEYQFRVKAVNKAGPGEASDPSRKVVAKPRNLKPWIDREAMKTITIKVGNDVEFDVPVRGEPPPKKEWIFNEKPVDDQKIRVRFYIFLNILIYDYFRLKAKTTRPDLCSVEQLASMLVCTLLLLPTLLEATNIPLRSLCSENHLAHWDLWKCRMSTKIAQIWSGKYQKMTEVLQLIIMKSKRWIWQLEDGSHVEEVKQQRPQFQIFNPDTNTNSVSEL